MTNELKRAYIKRVYGRYQKAKKGEKTLILDEMCQVFSLSRKHAIKLLNDDRNIFVKPLGPRRKYGPEVAHHLQILWENMNGMCSKNMREAIPIWLPYYNDCDRWIKELLLQISASTIDRLLKPYKKKSQRGLSSTKPSLIKNKIPLKLLDGDVKEPGFVEADTVAHCGNSLAGNFVNSLTVTDLNSSWTENRSLWTKERKQILKTMWSVENALPFKIKGIATDNGNEFLNHDLHNYFADREEKVEFVRRRPYKKNDNAHVEQKNWTHVRELFGYQRFDHPSMVELMNEIYRNYWNPLMNYFTPSMKLTEKTRIGGKVIKKYGKPKTPYQRLQESEHIDYEAKKRLQMSYQKLNPFKLKQELEQKLKWFFKIVDVHKNQLLDKAANDS